MFGMGRRDVFATGFLEHGFEVQLFGFVIGCVRIGDIAGDQRLGPGGVVRKGMGGRKDRRIGKHRGFSLDQFQPRLNPDSFRNRFQVTASVRNRNDEFSNCC